MRSSGSAKAYLEKRLGPLTLGALLESIRLGEEIGQAEFARKNVSPAKAAEYARTLATLNEVLAPQRAAEPGSQLDSAENSALSS